MVGLVWFGVVWIRLYTADGLPEEEFLDRGQSGKSAGSSGGLLLQQFRFAIYFSFAFWLARRLSCLQSHDRIGMSLCGLFRIV